MILDSIYPLLLHIVFNYSDVIGCICEIFIITKYFKFHILLKLIDTLLLVINT